MPDPTIAQKAPFAVEVESGKSYFWCAWGRSAKQPFCDGSHKGTQTQQRRAALRRQPPETLALRL
jgi:CDGSH-type Zn-finger protein